MAKRIALVIGAVLILMIGGLVVWASAANPIMPAAQAALQSDAQVEVTVGESLVFTPKGSQPTTGLIFYPGGKVDYRAYASYAHAVASQGYLVVIVKMPLNLAVFNAGAAAGVISDFPSVRHWAIGGHSLGGSMAANYAVRRSDQIQGLVLLASYPASSDNLANTGIEVVSIFGTNDGLATGNKIDASMPLLPTDTAYVAIQGGNHAQFGDYGIQKGDGSAKIDRADQQAQAAAATVDLLKRISEK